MSSQPISKWITGCPIRTIIRRAADIGSVRIVRILEELIQATPGLIWLGVPDRHPCGRNQISLELLGGRFGEGCKHDAPEPPLWNRLVRGIAFEWITELITGRARPFLS